MLLLFGITIILVQTSLLCIFFYIDILPLLKKKLIPQEYFNDINNEEYKNKVLQAAFHMAATPEVKMSLKENKRFIDDFLNLLNKTSQSDWRYNFPKAFLFLGLIEYCSNNKEYILEIQKLFSRYIDNTGTPTFRFNKIVHIPFALCSLKLYQLTSDLKYKSVCEIALSIIKEHTDSYGIVRYFNSGKNKEIFYVDGLGMYIPFLVEYSKEFNSHNTLEIAFKNMDHFIQFGTDQNHLPFHNIKNNIPLGPNNWGRGISWYALALSSLINVDEKYQREAKALNEVLETLKLDKNTWAQFLGTSDKFDASATIPILYFQKKLSKMNFSEKDIVNSLMKYTHTNGEINFTSGDTYGINIYSQKFTVSEFTQGVLLQLLSI